MKYLSNIFLLMAATLLLYACPQSLTPQMKAEMQIMYYLRDVYTDSLYRPVDFSEMTEIKPAKEGYTANRAKYKISHIYTIDGKIGKEERKGIFHIAPDYKVVYVE